MVITHYFDNNLGQLNDFKKITFSTFSILRELNANENRLTKRK